MFSIPAGHLYDQRREKEKAPDTSVKNIIDPRCYASSQQAG
jgi:hypothetical protein